MDFNKFKDVENIIKEGIALWNDIVSEVKQLKNINGEKFKSGFNTYFVDYLKNDYQGFYFVSSTTKVISDFGEFQNEEIREDFIYVVHDFRLY